MIYAMLGPSGSGKSVIARGSGLEPLVSHTTRPPRPGEQEGKDYYFISRTKFFNLKQNSFFIEDVKYEGEYYGLSHKEIRQKKNFQTYVIMDKEGIKQLKRYVDDIKVIYITAPKFQIFKRLIKRDGFIKGIKRFWYALKTKEFSNHDLADIHINNSNGNLGKSIGLFRSYIRKFKKIHLLGKGKNNGFI